MRSLVWGFCRSIIASSVFVAACAAQNIPKEIWGTWIVRRELPAATISCWGEPETGKLIGSELEYSENRFRWGDIITYHPVAETRMLTAGQFHDEYSAASANGSQVTLRQLGISAKQVREISIHHDPANITNGTIEIPGDTVVVKDANTIIFSVCNVCFEAKRNRTRAPR